MIAGLHDPKQVDALDAAKRATQAAFFGALDVLSGDEDV